MVDAGDSKSPALTGVPVRVRPWVPHFPHNIIKSALSGLYFCVVGLDLLCKQICNPVCVHYFINSSPNHQTTQHLSDFCFWVWYIRVQQSEIEMILIIRLSLFLIFVALLVVLARKALPRSEIIDGKPVKNKFFLIAGLGTFVALVLFVVAAEYITRL